jgi:hypothetical protein
LSRAIEARSTGSVDVQRRWWTRRRTSPSTSTLQGNDQVDVDDHERHVEDLCESSDVALHLDIRVNLDVNGQRHPPLAFQIARSPVRLTALPQQPHPGPAAQ